MIFSLLSFSQEINENWYFGDKAAVNFDSGSPVSVNGSQMDTTEGVATISDDLGQLLFYSDGRRVWDASHTIMPNGSSLSGSGHDYVQGVVIVPFPNHPNEYFIFTSNGAEDFVAYSKIDMTQNNGLGDVVELNTPLLDDAGTTVWFGQDVQAITAVSIGQDYRIVLPHRNRLLTYLVDNTGVTVTPIQSQIDFVLGHISQIKISPNNDYLAISDWTYKKTSIYHYNNNLGQVQSSIPLAIIQATSNSVDHNIYSAEFTSDSQYLWLTTFEARLLFAIDMNNLSNTPTIIDPNPIFTLCSIQRGIDNELYISTESNDYLSKLNNADNPSIASFIENDVFLGGNFCKKGLPQLVPIPGDGGSCPENLVLDIFETSTNILYETSNSITTTQNYGVGVGQNVTLSAGNYIDMLPHTDIQTGSVFLAKIEGCTPFVNFSLNNPLCIMI